MKKLSTVLAASLFTLFAHAQVGTAVHETGKSADETVKKAIP